MNGLVIDLFAGGGGASLGIERALGRPIDLAINHSAEAIAMHTRNHPHTRHERADVWAVSPREACEGRSVDLLWASPACTHFSRAKGGQNPKSAKVRALASVVIRWAREVRPRVICLENVEEFATWGPLDHEGKPIKAKAGKSFRCWLGKLRAQGYAVEYRSLVAADFGAPTTRKRLFLIARCDGEPIVWPTPTHGKGLPLPWRSAAECIDWSIPCPSIFDRKRPLAEATLRRIAAGIQRFVLGAARPFLVKYHGGEGRVVFRGQSVDEPLRTVDTENRFGLIVPTLIQLCYGEREGQAPRVLDLAQPLGTVVGTNKFGLVAAFIAKAFGGPNGAQTPGSQIDLPLGTVTSRDHNNLVTASLEPALADRRASAAAFLVKYYGSSGHPESQQQGLFEPLHTVTATARFGLVMVHGVPHEIVDIGMRMLDPRELFAAQGFPSDYRLDAELDGKPLTKTALIELCGNSVCPPVAEAIVRANLGDATARRAA